VVSSREVAIIDIGIGNIGSVYNAIYSLGYDPEIVQDPESLREFDRIILPGVGNFGAAMRKMESCGFIDSIREFALSGCPVLGICLGMQLLLAKSEESLGIDGLGLIPGDVKSFGNDSGYPVPHMGWNDLTLAKSEHPIFTDVKDCRDFYFVHSFHACVSEEFILASAFYPNKFAAVIGNDNVIGMQFHPEKSQVNGLKLLENFMSL
jgi:glutamine amidotransferase